MIKRLYIIILILVFLYIGRGICLGEGELSWIDCVKEAAANHPDLIAATEEIKQSEAGKDITASALYPQVDASLGASTARADNNKTSSTTDSYNYGATGSQLIFDGLKTVNEVKSAKETIKAFKENFKFTSATVRFRLRSAFTNLLTAQESLKITQDIYNIRRSNLELITLRYESGLEHRGALMTAQADLAVAQYNIRQAERDVEVAQRQLTKETGRTQFIPMRVSGNFQVREVVGNKPDFEKLALNNPSLLQLIAQKNAAEYTLRSTYGNFFPALNASAGGNKNGSHWPPKGDQWNLGLSLTLPIFEGGLRVAQVREAQAALNQLVANQRSTRDSLVYTLEQTWAQLKDAIDNTAVQVQQLAATLERSNIAQAQYSIGFIGFDNWTIIEDNLVNAKLDLLNAQSAMLLAEANWIQAKGETLEYE